MRLASTKSGAQNAESRSPSPNFIKKGFAGKQSARDV